MQITLYINMYHLRSQFLHSTIVYSLEVEHCKRLFRYTRLPFGISSAPGIFQCIMESLLQGIPGVIVYLDNILVSAPIEEEHLRRLEEVFARLKKSGLRARQSKCQFMVSEVSYLGHQIDAEGLHALPRGNCPSRMVRQS